MRLQDGSNLKTDNLAFFNDCCRCLLKNIGATIMGVKPIELRIIQLKKFKGQSVWNKCKEIILAYDEINILELERNQDRKKVLFYHTSALDNQLTKPYIRKFLIELGYPEHYNLNSYLQHLKTRFQSNHFPHEIGVFFGYPLKDVLGFMGYLDLEVTDCQEWKFYGNKEVSLKRKEEFDWARETFNHKLNEINNVQEFYKAIN
ncbi:MAG: DUF3793 family protein [Bacillota bacterium]